MTNFKHFFILHWNRWTSWNIFVTDCFTNGKNKSNEDILLFYIHLFCIIDKVVPHQVIVKILGWRALEIIMKFVKKVCKNKDAYLDQTISKQLEIMDSDENYRIDPLRLIFWFRIYLIQNRNPIRDYSGGGILTLQYQSYDVSTKLL